MERIIAYVDGYNLYYGLRSRGWKKYYWLNLPAMVVDLLKPKQSLVRTKYFTTIVAHPKSRQKRQAIFLEALQTLPDLEIYFGHFLSNPVTCHHCGHTYHTHHEKMTDVNIAVELLMDAFFNHFDTALLVSADSDLVGPIRAIRSSFSPKRVVVAFPPNRVSEALKSEADGYLHIGRNTLVNASSPKRSQSRMVLPYIAQ